MKGNTIMTLPQHLKFADDFAADPGDKLIPAFDMADLIGVTDYVRFDLPGSERTLYGTVVELREDIQYAKVESWNGTQRWVELDCISIVLKGSALELKAPQTEVKSA